MLAIETERYDFLDHPGVAHDRGALVGSRRVGTLGSLVRVFHLFVRSLKGHFDNIPLCLVIVKEMQRRRKIG